jgi:hypothetical protein
MNPEEKSFQKIVYHLFAMLALITGYLATLPPLSPAP